MNDAELRSMERLCSKDDLSDSNVASLTALGLKAAGALRRAIGFEADLEQSRSRHKMCQESLAAAVAERDQLRARVDELEALINTPRTDDLFEAVRVEAAHQIERWGVEHDAGKRAEDWTALLVRLLGKVVDAHWNGDRDKLLHHVITLAAVALNWHGHMTCGSTAIREDIER